MTPHPWSSPPSPQRYPPPDAAPSRAVPHVAVHGPQSGAPQVTPRSVGAPQDEAPVITPVVTPVAVAVLPTPRLRRLRRRIAICSLGVLVSEWLVAALELVAGLDGAHLAATLPARLVAVVGVGFLVATWVTTSTWFSRAAAAARAAEPQTVACRSWLAWAMWVLPVVSWYLPAFLVLEVWGVGARSTARYLQARVGAWWGIWLLANVVAVVVRLVAGSAWTANPLWTSATVVGLLLSTLALRLWFDVVDGLTRAWEKPRVSPGRISLGAADPAGAGSGDIASFLMIGVGDDAARRPRAGRA